MGDGMGWDSDAQTLIMVLLLLLLVHRVFLIINIEKIKSETQIPAHNQNLAFEAYQLLLSLFNLNSKRRGLCSSFDEPSHLPWTTFYKK